MADPSVTADNTRIAQAIAGDTGTWGDIGGGAGSASEPDIVYQGSSSWSRKVGIAVRGLDYTHSATVDMDGTPASTAHVMIKIQATNYGALETLTTPAMRVRIGTSSTVYHGYYLFGRDNYPVLGGWQILAIAPSVSGYRDNSAGTPALGSVDYFGLAALFIRTSKSENLIMDAIDIGLGLNLVGGDGASPDATFQDFIDYDEGTAGNRFGYVYTLGGVIFPSGQLTIGQTAAGTSTHTDFTDSNITLVWRNGLVTTGFNRLLLELGTSGTVITINNCSFGSEGEENNTAGRGYTTTEDSRPIFEVSGTTGIAYLEGCTFSNFASFELNSATTFLSCVMTNSGQITADAGGTGAEFTNNTISSYTGAANTSALVWNSSTNPSAKLANNTFNANDSILSHAIEFGLSSPTVIDLNNMTYTGYSASNNVNDSMLHIKRTTGTVTLNINGGTTPSYRTDGADVVIVNSVPITLTALDASTGAVVVGARLSLEADSGGNLAALSSTTITRSGTTATATCTAHGLETGDTVIVRGADQNDYNIIATVTVTDANTFTYTVANSPTTPATGTITSTAQILSDTTNGSGVISSTSFNFSTDQPVIGRLRKGTTSPYYKSAAFSGTITENGFTANISMIPDE